MKKIVYLIDQPLDERNFERFGVQTWIDRGWIVEVWDLTAIVYPRAWQSFLESGIKLVIFEGYFSIASVSELKQRFSRLRNVKHFIDLSGDGYLQVRTKMRLIGAGAVRVICATGSIPTPYDSNERGIASNWRKALRVPAKSLGRRLIGAAVRKMVAPFIRPGLIVASGEKSLPAANRTQEILRAHNFDYDIYLRQRQSIGGRPAGRYAVFLDQNICFHPEYIYEGVPFYATPEKYFPTICNGLRTISGALETPLRIAAHPRLPRQSKYIDYFEGIPVEYGNTAELISNCAFVVCHFTTAMQFAVLFRKPVIFVTTNELLASAANKYIERFAESLGKAVINLDSELSAADWPLQLNIDSQRYDEYRNRYIKIDGTPETPHWDMVIDHIEKSSRASSADELKREPCVSGGG